MKKLVPIDPILDRVRGSMGRLAREREARITLDLTGGRGALVFASPIEIEQALTNVVENALQSRSRGAHVEIERRVEHDRVEIVIRDDGQGIQSGDLAHVLDPFFTSRLEAGGTGLGLSVAHGVAEDHGGTLSIESEPDRGTTVVLGFPRGDG